MRLRAGWERCFRIYPDVIFLGLRRRSLLWIRWIRARLHASSSPKSIEVLRISLMVDPDSSGFAEVLQGKRVPFSIGGELSKFCSDASRRTDFSALACWFKKPLSQGLGELDRHLTDESKSSFWLIGPKFWCICTISLCKDVTLVHKPSTIISNLANLLDTSTNTDSNDSRIRRCEEFMVVFASKVEDFVVSCETTENFALLLFFAISAF